MADVVENKTIRGLSSLWDFSDVMETLITCL